MVRRWGLGAIALVAACKFTPPQDLPSDARLVDGPAPGDSNLIDAPVVPPDAPFVCSASTLACSSGIALTHTCGGHCWVSCTAAGDQPTAAAACTNWGGKLAPIET